MVFLRVVPDGEVSDVTLTPQLRGPGLAGALNGRVDPDGEKDFLFATPAAFFLQGGFYFITHPFAFDGVFGEDEKEFVVEADGVFDDVAEGVSYLQVFGSKPAADAGLLEVVV